MANQTIEMTPEPREQSPRMYDWASTEKYVPEDSGVGLSSHVTNLRKRSRGFFRWLGLAVFVGAITALAFIAFLAK